MMTKNEMIATLKKDNPTLKVGDDTNGYTQLSEVDYEAQIAEWAEAQFSLESAKAQTATAKAALLVKLGITADEFKTLLGGN